MRRPSQIRRRSADRWLPLIGSLTAVVLGAAIYLSATATSGPPWAKPYRVQIQLPDAERLVVDDAVRIDGRRVGRVSDVRARPAADGDPQRAVITIELNHAVEPLPVDTVVRARAASVLGASFVDLDPGRAENSVPDGGSLPLGNARPSVALTDIFDTFDRRTRASIRETLSASAAGLVGRGASLGLVLDRTAALLPGLDRVTAQLADPGTRVESWIRGFRALSNELAPESAPLAGVVRSGAVTFGALAARPAELDLTLRRLPGTEATLTDALERLAPSLRRLSRLMTNLRPAGPQLRPALRQTTLALVAGVPGLGAVPPLAGRLDTTIRDVRSLVSTPSTPGGLRAVARTLSAARPAVQMLEVGQRECNVMSAMLANFAAFGEMPLLGSGSSLARVPTGVLAVTHVGAQGEEFQSSKPASNVAINYLPNENADECEGGNERHDGVTQVLGNPPGSQGKRMPPPVVWPEARQRAKAAGLLDTPAGWTP